MNYKLFLKNKKIIKEYKLNNKVIIDNYSFGILFSYKKWVRKTQRHRENMTMISILASPANTTHYFCCWTRKGSSVFQFSSTVPSFCLCHNLWVVFFLSRFYNSIGYEGLTLDHMIWKYCWALWSLVFVWSGLATQPE